MSTHPFFAGMNAAIEMMRENGAFVQVSQELFTKAVKAALIAAGVPEPNLHNIETARANLAKIEQELAVLCRKRADAEVAAMKAKWVLYDLENGNEGDK